MAKPIAKKSLEDVVAEHKDIAVRLQALKDKRHALLAKHAKVFDEERALSEEIAGLARQVSDTRDEINARLQSVKV